VPESAAVRFDEQGPRENDETNNACADTVTVANSADLKVTKTAPSNANAGDFVIYTIAVQNLGPSNIRRRRCLTRCSTEFQNATFCTGAACDPSTGSAWTGSTSLAGIAKRPRRTTVKIRAQIKPSSTVTSISNTASVSAQGRLPIRFPGNDSSTVTTTVARAADLKVTKTAGTDPVIAGNNEVYTIKVDNLGPSDAGRLQCD
jgi:hypothetical protein